ncbi:hypothetical protein HMPREF1869_01783 [Bacteroidales bacterium KA00251]|nr:hypothetical protein HMPREF1869_01783 [Bacteroidales bacterium KA00251]
MLPIQLSPCSVRLDRAFTTLQLLKNSTEGLVGLQYYSIRIS